MHKQRIYIDTSVVGGCFDKEFEEWSNLLFDTFIKGINIAIVSDVVLEELVEASEKIKNKIDEIPSNFIELVYRNEVAENLSDQYINAKAISPKYSDDALHVAIATIQNVDVLVSWNFKHLVNYNRIVKYNEINLINGYKQIEIRSPKEVIDYEEDI